MNLCMYEHVQPNQCSLYLLRHDLDDDLKEVLGPELITGELIVSRLINSFNDRTVYVEIHLVQEDVLDHWSFPKSSLNHFNYFFHRVEKEKAQKPKSQQIQGKSKLKYVLTF